MNKVIAAIIGLFVFGVLGFFSWFFIQSLLEADPGIAAAVIGAMSVMVAGIWSHYSNRRREINSRHFIEKKNAYMHLINLIFDIFKSIKKDESITEDELLERMFDFKRELMVWGDKTVIEALDTYERNSIALLDEKNPSQTLLLVDDLLRSIRKDLGHNDSQLERGNLVRMLIVADEKDKVISDKTTKSAS